MLEVKRITVLTPELSEPLLNQEQTHSKKIKSLGGLWGVGNCTYTCKFEKDILYPGDEIKLTITVDNNLCNKKIEKYKVKLLRRTQVFNLVTTKPIYTNDCILMSEKYDAACAAKSEETKQINITLPQTIYVTPSEEERIKIPLMEKSLAQGPSSSISGRLFKVQYVL